MTQILRFDEYPIQGFTLITYTLKKQGERWDYHFDLLAGKHPVGGGDSHGGTYITQADALVAATSEAKARITCLLDQKPLNQWLEHGVGD